MLIKFPKLIKNLLKSLRKNDYPALNKFLFVSGDPVTYATRQAPISYNLNNATESSKNIQWSKGTLSPVVKKVWLFIGYKNSVTGKNLRITNIALT
jgi:hypothetical protein